MDVTKPVLAILFLMFLSACGGTKQIGEVFDEGHQNQNSSPCGQKIKNQFIVQWEDGRIEKYNWADAESFKKEFIKPNLALIKRVEYNQRITMAQPEISATAAYAADWGQKITQADQVWSQGVTGQGVTVGIVDTWVDTSHPQLQNQFNVNSGEVPNNGVDDDGNGFVDDYYGHVFFTEIPLQPGEPVENKYPYHGSHVAGVVVAQHGQGPVKGVAPGAKIIQAPFLNRMGSGDLADGIRALDYLKSRNVKVVNASWGSSSCEDSQILNEKIQDLGQAGILVVVAAGNDGNDIEIVPMFPAYLNNTNQITVAWSTPFDILKSYSNYSYNLVHLAAPGEDIVSTVPFAIGTGGTASLKGTSMATPFVAATAALLWSVKPTATVAQIKQALLQSVDVGNFPVVTRGRLNVKKAVDQIRQIVP